MSVYVLLPETHFLTLCESCHCLKMVDWPSVLPNMTEHVIYRLPHSQVRLTSNRLRNKNLAWHLPAYARKARPPCSAFCIPPEALFP